MRYSMVSAVAVAVNQVCLLALFAGLHWKARPANVAACAVASIPNYWLNRRWTWGKTGRSHLLKEVVPFWSLAFVGLALSTLAAGLAEDLAPNVTSSRLGQGIIVSIASLTAFGLVWVGKFVFLNKVLFVTREEPPSGARADEAVA